MSLTASWPKLLGIAFVLLTVVVLAAGGIFYFQVQNLPVYEEGQEAPVDGIAVNTLRHGDLTYTSGPFEFSLEAIEQPFDIPLTRLAGKTSHGLNLIKPIGHDGSRFLVARGEMNADSVYQSNGASRVTLDDLDVNAIEYINDFEGSPTTKRTSDETIISDLVTVLVSGPTITAQPSESNKIYHVRLLSDQLPGLAYFAYVVVDEQGNIYLTHRAMEDQLWIPVGKQLSDWLRPGA